MSKRKSPARSVVSVVKVGRYGSTEYRITLECDHVVLAPRKPPADSVRCTSCLNGEPARPVDTVPLDPVTAMLALETRTRESLALRLGVPSDSIEIIFDPFTPDPTIGQVVVRLDPALVDSLISR